MIKQTKDTIRGYYNNMCIISLELRDRGWVVEMLAGPSSNSMGSRTVNDMIKIKEHLAIQQEVLDIAICYQNKIKI